MWSGSVSGDVRAVPDSRVDADGMLGIIIECAQASDDRDGVALPHCGGSAPGFFVEKQDGDKIGARRMFFRAGGIGDGQYEV